MAIAKANRALLALSKLIRTDLIQPYIKVNIYKLYIRPVLAYASPVWCNIPNLSAHQRKILRQATNTRREIGSFKFINNTILYKKTNIPRIDNFIIKNNISFYSKCNSSNREKEKSFTDNGTPGKYSNLSYMYHASRNGTLHTDNKLLLFHRPYRNTNSNRTIYNINQ